MSSSFRDELLERELSAEGKDTNAVAGGLFYAKPTVSYSCRHEITTRWFRAVVVRS